MEDVIKKICRPGVDSPTSLCKRPFFDQFYRGVIDIQGDQDTHLFCLKAHVARYLILINDATVASDNKEDAFNVVEENSFHGQQAPGIVCMGWVARS